MTSSKTTSALVCAAIPALALAAFACDTGGGEAGTTAAVSGEMPSPTAAAVAAVSNESPSPTAAVDSPAPTPTPAGRDDGDPDGPPPASVIPVPPDRDLYELAARLRPDAGEAPLRTVSTPFAPQEVGNRATFKVVHLADRSVHTVDAALYHVSENAYWYVDERLEFDDTRLKTAATEFETRVRPAITGGIGDIWSPGVDGDPRLTVLYTDIGRGLGGFYGSHDEYTVQVHPNSNEREIIYISRDYLSSGNEAHVKVLAHEFQHAVHWNLDMSEDSWVNEGMAEIAVEMSGYSAHSIDQFLRLPSVQLNYFYLTPGSRETQAHYGAGALFMDYLRQHYGGDEGMGELAREQADGIAGVNAYLEARGTGFRQVFKDWTVANLIDAPVGRYGYPNRKVSTMKVDVMYGTGPRSDSLAQFGTRYLDLKPGLSDFSVEFQGMKEVPIFGADCHSGDYCWWSNQGDLIDSTLTREFDLTEAPSATLNYMAWYDIEEGWDYAYLQASGDGGRTWDILHPPRASDSDTTGNAYGPGYTGKSNGWLRETVDLSAYTGGKVLVRFEYVTDDAVYDDGFVLDGFEVPEVAFVDDAEADGGWTAAGFARTHNTLPQDYFVQVVMKPANGSYDIFEVPLDENRRGTFTVQGLGSAYDQVILVVSPSTEGTHQETTYKVRITPTAK